MPIITKEQAGPIDRRHPLSQGLLLDYATNEGAGTLQSEGISPSFPMVPGGGAVWGVSPGGRTLNCLGTSTGAQATTPLLLRPQRGSMAWRGYLSTTSAGGANLFGLYYSGSPYACMKLIYNNPFASLEWNRSGGYQNMTGIAYPTGGAMTYVITWDATGSWTPYIYANGVATGSSNFGTGAIAYGSVSGLQFGNLGDSSRNAAAKMLGFRMWNRVISPNEIQSLTNDWWQNRQPSSRVAVFAMGSPRLGPGGTSGCAFSSYNILPSGADGDAITTIADFSGSGNTATPSGTGLVLKAGTAKIGSMNVVRSDGAHRANLTNTISNTAGLTLLAVGRRTTATKWFPLGSSTNVNTLLGISNDDNIYGVDDTNGYVSTGTAPSSAFLCYWTVTAAGLVQFRGGGKALTTLTHSGTGLIGAQNFSAILGRSGDYTASGNDYAAIVIFPRVLSPTELTNEWQALATLTGFDLDGATYPYAATSIITLASYLARRRRIN
jgi:hypothetical protein